MSKSKVWIADIETFANCFTLVVEDLEGNVLEFVLHESRDDFDSLMSFLAEKPAFVGFNWRSFDSQVIEEIWRKKLRDPKQIYQYAQSVIEGLQEDRFNLPYPEWHITFQFLDIYLLMHYDNNARRTSLKWIEFTTRQKKLADLPYDHTTELTDKQVEELVKYNKYDVKVTKAFYEICKPQIELRKELYREYREPRLMNMSDSTIGSFIFSKILSDRLSISEKELKKKRTNRSKIVVNDLLLKYISFETREFQSVKEFYEKVVVKAVGGEIKLKGVVEHSVEFDGMSYDFGAGGLHGARGNNVYEADDNCEIWSIDAKSYYPHLSFLNSIYPEHLGAEFCDIFRDIYVERTKHAKGTAKNAGYKIVLNGSYGRTNSKYSFLYDPQMTLSICVNGQLTLCMLAEQVTKFGGKVIMVNTDGIEIIVPKDKKEVILKACKDWELITGQVLEYEYYKKLFLRDCNNYIGIFENGSVKRKGQFETYEDIIENATWHKNPSAAIIPKAINEYVVNGTPIEDTIMEENNVHEFLYGVKKTKAFDFIWWVATEDRVVRPKNKIKDRVLRYYASKNGGSIYKHWNDGRITGLNVGQLVTPAQTLRSERAELFTDIDREYYIEEARKIVDSVEN